MNHLLDTRFLGRTFSNQAPMPMGQFRTWYRLSDSRTFKMDLCFPYRYFIVIMAGIGFFLVTSFRVIFALMITHATKGNESFIESPTIFPGCKHYNDSEDYASHYSEGMDMQFHAVFFVGMTFGNFLSGIIASRFPANRVLGFGILSSSVLFLALPEVFKLSSVGVFAIRVVQGYLEGLFIPSFAALVSSWALKHERSNVFSIGMLGLYLSPAITNIAGGACLCYISWDAGVYIFGVIGIVWSLTWTCIAFPLPQECPYVGRDELLRFAKEGEVITRGTTDLSGRDIPWKKILTSKAVWAIWLGFFCQNFVKSIVVTLQPQIYKDLYGLRVSDIGLLLSIPHIIKAILTFVSSYIADYLITYTTFTVTTIRKLLQCSGSSLQAVFFICMIFAGGWRSSFTFLTLAYAMSGISFSGHACNMMDLSPQFTGAISAVATTGVVGGAVSTIIASFVAVTDDSEKNWYIMIWLEAGIAACTVLVYGLCASAERQAWVPQKRVSTGSTRSGSYRDDSDHASSLLLDDAYISSFSGSSQIYSSAVSV